MSSDNKTEIQAYRLLVYGRTVSGDIARMDMTLHCTAFKTALDMAKSDLIALEAMNVIKQWQLSFCMAEGCRKHAIVTCQATFFDANIVAWARLCGDPACRQVFDRLLVEQLQRHTTEHEDKSKRVKRQMKSKNIESA